MSANNENGGVSLRKQVLGWWVVFAGFVVLGSFYPFRFGTGTLSQAVTQWASFADVSKSDLAINLLAGFPIGFLGSLAVAGRSRRATRLVITTTIVLAFSVLLSTFVEIGQFWIEGRVSSRYDTVAQIFGACVGVGIAILRGDWLLDRIHHVRSSVGRNAVEAFLDLYLVGYLVFMLQPFVPAVSPTELASKWRSGAIEPIPFLVWLTDPWVAGYTIVVCVSTAIPVGFWFARRLATSPLPQCAIIAAISLAMLEVSQIAIELRTASADDAIWSAVGAICGVVFGRRYAAELGVYFERQGPLVLKLIAISFTALYLMTSLAPFDFVGSSDQLIERLNHWWADPVGLRGNDFRMGSNLFRVAMWSAALGISMGLAFNRRRGWLGFSLCFAAVVVLTALAEMIQLLSDSRFPSLLAAGSRMLAGIAGLLVVMRSPLLGFAQDPAQFPLDVDR